MDNAGTPKTAIESLRTVEFRLGLRGYDVDEVDDFRLRPFFDEALSLELDAQSFELDAPDLEN